MKTRWSFRRHFWLLTVLSVLCVAQLGWWVYYQVLEGRRIMRAAEQIWEREIQLAEMMLEQPGALRDSAWLTSRFPDLEIAAEGRVQVREAAREEIEEAAGRSVRMFIHEGVFMILLLAAGILYMYWTLRKEIEFERRQSTFLAATSHELKTPITSLRLFLDTLRNRELSAEQKDQALATMNRDLDRLGALIDRLLQAQSMIGYPNRVRLTETDLSEETRAAIEQDRHVLDRGESELQIEIADDVLAMADPERWRLMVKNLVENAFKYSPNSGQVRVRLESHGRLARLTITDQGIGLAPGEHEKIFERFYRVGNEDTRRSTGTGLGLFLVRRIARSFRGRAYATSPGPGQGATFVVEIPRIEER